MSISTINNLYHNKKIDKIKIFIDFKIKHLYNKIAFYIKKRTLEV